MREDKITVNMLRRMLLIPPIIIILSVVAIFAAGQDAAAVKLGTELVSVRVTVTDRGGRAIEGLCKGAFKIYEDKVEQPLSFFSDEDAPASIGIVFDISNSMGGAKIIRAREALARFLQTSHEQDEYFLISFSSSPQLLLDGARDSKAIMDRLNNAQPSGETALYDAVYLGLEKVSQGTYPKRAIILISDGEDNHSRRSFDQVRRKLQESDILVYTIGIDGSYPSPKARILANGEFVMNKLASISGGRSFWPGNADEMNETFEQIALELRRQYSIGYLPSNFVADGRWHRLKVTVTIPREQPRPVVRSREGYYAVKISDNRRGNMGRNP
jgi:Ca-activated chloride channel homolog